MRGADCAHLQLTVLSACSVSSQRPESEVRESGEVLSAYTLLHTFDRVAHTCRVTSPLVSYTHTVHYRFILHMVGDPTVL